MENNARDKRSPGESFGKTLEAFGDALSEIFKDPALKEKAREFGKSAAESAGALGRRLKDEDVREKFRDAARAAHDLGKTLGDYFAAEGETSGPAPEDRTKAQDKKQHSAPAGGSTTGLQSNVASLLCYVGFWITGIVFLIIEQRDRAVRFHAVQAIVTFGSLAVASVFLGWAPILGPFLSAAVGVLGFILWILLMVKSYQGEIYRVPVAGDVAASLVPPSPREEEPEVRAKPMAAGPRQTTVTTETAPSAKAKGADNAAADVSRARAGRVAGYTAAIFWDVALLVLFTYLYQYIAWYDVRPDGSVARLPLLTDQYFVWLPLLVASLALSIAANVTLIIYDRYWLRETLQIILGVFTTVVVANLLLVFPFDFRVIPSPTAAYFVPIAVTVVLALITIGSGVGALVRFIKLIVNLIKRTPGT